MPDITHKTPRKSAANLPAKPLVEVIPVVLNGRMQELAAQLASATGEAPGIPVVDLTPNRTTISSAVSASGSKMVSYSPFEKISLSRTSSTGEKTTLDVHFLVRESAHVKRQDSLLQKTIRDSASLGSPVKQAVTISPATREQQRARKSAKREKAVVGQSAKNVVLNYLLSRHPELDQDVIKAEAKALNYNLCHLLGYALANNALSDTGHPFETQQKQNIFSGSRQLNEAVFPIEKTLLDFIEKNKVKEIKYMGVCTPYRELHAIAELSLSAEMITASGATLSFTQAFCADETRRLSQEVTTIFNAAMTIMLDSPPAHEKQQSLAHQTPNTKPTALPADTEYGESVSKKLFVDFSSDVSQKKKSRMGSASFFQPATKRGPMPENPKSSTPKP